MNTVGKDVDRHTFTREDRTRYREKVRRCLEVFARMLRESRFDFERPLTGLEIELNLVDEGAEPVLRNAEVLGAIADPDFVTELGQFNIEINVAPRQLGDRGLTAFEEQVRASLNAAEGKARTVDAHLVTFSRHLAKLVVHQPAQRVGRSDGSGTAGRSDGRPRSVAGRGGGSAD